MKNRDDEGRAAVERQANIWAATALSNDERNLARVSQGRIREYRRHSLDAADPLEASLGNLIADLLVLQTHAAARLQAEFAAGCENLEQLEGLNSTMDLQIRFAKQITQLTRLTKEIGEQRAGRPART